MDLSNILQSVDDVLAGKGRTYPKSKLSADIRLLKASGQTKTGDLPKHGTVDAETLARLRE